MSKVFYLNIHQPCHEKWSEMTANEKGAWCQSCRKNVIDFTNKTENEIYEIVSSSKEQLCGRFNSYQLNQPIRKTEIHRSFFNLKTIAASVMAFFSVQRIYAGSDTAPKPKVVKEQKNLLDTISIVRTAIVSNPDINNDSVSTIKGKVVDIDSREPIPFASVLLKKSRKVVYTDIDGYFSLPVKEKEDSVYISMIGYQPQTIPVHQFLPGEKIVTLAFRAEMLGMVGLIITVDKPAQFDRLTDMPVDFELLPRVQPPLKGD